MSDSLSPKCVAGVIVFMPTLWRCRGHGNGPFISLNTGEFFMFLPLNRTDNTCFSSLDLFLHPWGKPLPILMFFQVDHHIDHRSRYFLISSRGRSSSNSTSASDAQSSTTNGFKPAWGSHKLSMPVSDSKSALLPSALEI
jgi:hypothetical protein